MKRHYTPEEQSPPDCTHHARIIGEDDEAVVIQKVTIQFLQEVCLNIDNGLKG
jgi:hypothetical protein